MSCPTNVSLSNSLKSWARSSQVISLLLTIELPFASVCLLAFLLNISKDGTQVRRQKTCSARQKGSRKEIHWWPEEGFQEGC